MSAPLFMPPDPSTNDYVVIQIFFLLLREFLQKNLVFLIDVM